MAFPADMPESFLRPISHELLFETYLVQVEEARFAMNIKDYDHCTSICLNLLRQPDLHRDHKIIANLLLSLTGPIPDVIAHAREGIRLAQQMYEETPDTRSHAVLETAKFGLINAEKREAIFELMVKDGRDAATGGTGIAREASEGEVKGVDDKGTTEYLANSPIAQSRQRELRIAIAERADSDQKL